MKEIRLGIIGVGAIGMKHAGYVVRGEVPGMRLTALANHTPGSTARCAEALGVEAACFDDGIALLDSGEVDACLISTPHGEHARLAAACLERGIHVMVEKPIALHAGEARALNTVANQHPDVVFGMMYNQRTNPLYRRMRELVQGGRYGRVRRVNWLITDWYRPQAYYDAASWRATWAGEGGGVLMNQCVHQLDLWQWMFGMPVLVQSHMRFGQWHDIETEDDVTAYMEYGSGATGVFVASTGDGCGTNRLEVQMDGAKLVAEGGRLKLSELKVSEPEFSRACREPFGKIPVMETAVDVSGENMQHVGVLRAWVAAIMRGEPLVADGREGIAGLTLGNAMHLSAFLGRAVTLPLDEKLYARELGKRMRG